MSDRPVSSEPLMEAAAFDAGYDALICGARHPADPATCRLAPGHEGDHATARRDVTWSEPDCAHVVITTFGDGENGPSLWACEDCRLRFYPACRTCVDVGHRNIEHPAARSATPSSEEDEDERKASEFREIEDDAPTYADGCTVPLDRDGIAIFPIPEHVHEPPLATPDNAGRAATPARSDAGDGLDVERLQRAYEACDVEFMTSAETLSSFLRRVAAEYARLSESTGSEEGAS